jgi:hypothetical protein
MSKLQDLLFKAKPNPKQHLRHQQQWTALGLHCIRSATAIPSGNPRHIAVQYLINRASDSSKACLDAPCLAWPLLVCTTLPALSSGHSSHPAALAHLLYATLRSAAGLAHRFSTGARVSACAMCPLAARFSVGHMLPAASLVM